MDMADEYPDNCAYSVSPHRSYTLTMEKQARVSYRQEFYFLW